MIPTQLATVLAHMSEAYRPPFHQAADTSRELTRRFRSLLAEHHTVKQRVTDYAGLLHVTPNHLNKVVKETTSKSPTRWIDEAILLDAKVLLGQTDGGGDRRGLPEEREGGLDAPGEREEAPGARE